MAPAACGPGALAVHSRPARRPGVRRSSAWLLVRSHAGWARIAVAAGATSAAPLARTASSHSNKPIRESRLGLDIQATTPGHVVVCEVVPGALADRAGLKVGDRLVQVDGAQVRSMDHAAGLLQSAVGAVALVVAPTAGTPSAGSIASGGSSLPSSQPSSQTASVTSSPTAGARRGAPTHTHAAMGSAFDFMNGATDAKAAGSAFAFMNPAVVSTSQGTPQSAAGLTPFVPVMIGLRVNCARS